MKSVRWSRGFSLFFLFNCVKCILTFGNHLILRRCGTWHAVVWCLCDIPPSLPHADLQGALNANVLLAAGPSLHFTDDSLQSSAAYNTHRLPTEGERGGEREGRTQLHTKAAASTGLDFLPVKPPDSPVTSDVFQLAPFKTPTKDNTSSGASFSASHKPRETLDIFLQAPFGKKQETTKTVSGNAHMLKETQSVKARHLVPAPPPATATSPGVQPTFGHMETPVLQQPVAVHRVVSRIGQQAAVGSVAVGPLHAWTVGGRALEDPFTAAPFQPRCSHQKPWRRLTFVFFCHAQSQRTVNGSISQAPLSWGRFFWTNRLENQTKCQIWPSL